MSRLPPNASPTSREDAGDVVVRADVARGDERALDRRGELAHVLLDPLALVGERELGAAVGEPLGDRPRDRALVGDAEDEPALAVEGAGHGRTLNSLRIPWPALRRALVPWLRCAALSAGRRLARALQPIRRDFGERSLPRVRWHDPRADRPAQQGARPRDRHGSRCRRSRRSTGAGSGGRRSLRRLDVRNAPPRLPRAARRRARPAPSQAAAGVPQARVGRRYVLLDGLAVTVPARQLPKLLRLRFVTRV